MSEISRYYAGCGVLQTPSVNTIMEVDNYGKLSRNNPAEKSGLQ